MELEFKKWLEVVAGYNIVAQNQNQRVNPLVKGAAKFGMNVLAAGGDSFRDSLGQNSGKTQDHSQVIDQIIRDVNVDNNYLQFSVLVPLPEDGDENAAKDTAVAEARNSKTAQQWATRYGADLANPEVVKVEVDQKRQQIKVRLRFRLNIRTSDRLSYAYQNTGMQQNQRF